MAKRQKLGVKKTKVLKKGHSVTPLPSKESQANKKGRLANRTKFIRGVVRDVVGYAPYEKKMLELLQIGGASEAKKALKIAKQRLGTFRRGTAKRESMQQIAMEMRR